MLKVTIIPVTPFQQNCALIYDDVTLQGAVIDPGGDVPKIEAAIKQAGVTVGQIYLTHGHLDHAGGAAALSRALGVKIIGPDKRDAFLLAELETAGRNFGVPMENVTPDEWLTEGDEINIGGETFEVLHCPGHTPGHVVFINRAQNFGILGDVLFRNSVGRTDFPYGDTEQLITAIKTKLMVLPDDFTFICGHGNSSSIGAERRSNPFHSVSFLTRVAPGILLCIAVTLVATMLQMVEARLVGQAYLEALVLAILLGVGIRTVWHPGDFWHDGIVFAGKILLEIAIVLLGAAVSVRTVAALGPVLLIGIILVVSAAICSSYVISRGFGLTHKMALLIACGNSICGNSAIVAVAPVIGAEGDDVAAAIAFTAVLGVIVVLLLPLLVPILALSLTQYGVLAGLTVYAVPQVLAATLPIGALSNQVGTVVKLVRVLMLGPVVLGLSLLIRRGGPKLKFFELVPWFIAGFLLVLLARSLGFIPKLMIIPLKNIAAALTTISMAALGLGVDVRVVAKAGIRVTGAVTLSLIVLGGISYGLIRLLQIA